MILLVCGSRDWADDAAVEFVCEAFFNAHDSLTVIEGGARGADKAAGRWAARARRVGVGWVHVPAKWTEHGRAAGPIRNQEMLEYIKGADACVVAFKDGFDGSLKRGGTEDMVRRAKEAGVKTYVVSHG